MIEIIAALFRFLGVVAVLLAVGPGTRIIPSLFINWDEIEEGSTWMLVLSFSLPIMLPILMGIILWIAAPWLAKKVFRNVEESETRINGISAEEVQRVLFSAIGLLIFAWSIPSIGKLAYYYWQLSTPQGVEVGSFVERIGAVIEIFLNTVIGLLLLFNATRFSKLITKIRGQ